MPSPSSTYNCFYTKGIKNLTRLHLGLSYICDHKFKHGFLDSLKQICSCGLDIERTCHYLLHRPNFMNERILLLNISKITKDALPSCNITFIKRLSGDDCLGDKQSNIICIYWLYLAE